MKHLEEFGLEGAKFVLKKTCGNDHFIVTPSQGDPHLYAVGNSVKNFIFLPPNGCPLQIPTLFIAHLLFNSVIA